MAFVAHAYLAEAQIMHKEPILRKETSEHLNRNMNDNISSKERKFKATVDISEEK
jgi:hypothetical protein